MAHCRADGPLSMTMAAEPAYLVNASSLPSGCSSTGFSNRISLTGYVFGGGYVGSESISIAESSTADGAIVIGRSGPLARSMQARERNIMTLRGVESYREPIDLLLGLMDKFILLFVSPPADPVADCHRYSKLPVRLPNYWARLPRLSHPERLRALHRCHQPIWAARGASRHYEVASRYGFGLARYKHDGAQSVDRNAN